MKTPEIKSVLQIYDQHGHGIVSRKLTLDIAELYAIGHFIGRTEQAIDMMMLGETDKGVEMATGNLIHTLQEACSFLKKITKGIEMPNKAYEVLFSDKDADLPFEP